jgi:hypothetical protein
MQNVLVENECCDYCVVYVFMLGGNWMSRSSTESLLDFRSEFARSVSALCHRFASDFFSSAGVKVLESHRERGLYILSDFEAIAATMLDSIFRSANYKLFATA